MPNTVVDLDDREEKITIFSHGAYVHPKRGRNTVNEKNIQIGKW